MTKRRQTLDSWLRFLCLTMEWFSNCPVCLSVCLSVCRSSLRAVRQVEQLLSSVIWILEIHMEESRCSWLTICVPLRSNTELDKKLIHNTSTAAQPQSLYYPNKNTKPSWTFR